MDQKFLSGRQPRPPAERRAQPRLRVQLPALASGGHSWRVHDISRVGLSLLTEQPLSQGETLTLELVDTASGRRCSFEAQVVWSAPGEPGRAGLRFVHLSPEQNAWLSSRFNEWLAAGHEPAE
jgi:PilZ domain-containing protein